jgi:hypothetical protein
MNLLHLLLWVSQALKGRVFANLEQVKTDAFADVMKDGQQHVPHRVVKCTPVARPANPGNYTEGMDYDLAYSQYNTYGFLFSVFDAVNHCLYGVLREGERYPVMGTHVSSTGFEWSVRVLVCLLDGNKKLVAVLELLDIRVPETACEKEIAAHAAAYVTDQYVKALTTALSGVNGGSIWVAFQDPPSAGTKRSTDGVAAITWVV